LNIYVTKPASDFPALDIEPLKQLVSESGGFVAGGTFKSLFMGTEPKDYDVFFEDQSSFIKAKDFYRSTLRFTEVRGSQNVLKFKDIDMETPIELINSNSVLGGFKSLRDTLSTFDFSIAKFALYAKENDLFVTFHKDYFEHLFTKQLVVEAGVPLNSPFKAFSRAIKYSTYGFTISPVNQARILENITKRGEKTAAQIKLLLDSYNS
jgi:hypothetical protein